MKKSLIFRIFSLAMIVLAFTACNNSDEPKLPDDVPLWLQYRLELQKNINGVIEYNAFANFRAYSATGQLVKLNNGAEILINGKGMTYFHTEEAKDSWDYFRQFTSNEISGDVGFNFNRGNGKSVMVKVNPDEVISTPIPESLRSLTRGQVIMLQVDHLRPVAYTLSLSMRTSTGAVIYNCENIGAGSFRVPDNAPVASTYSLILTTDEVRSIPMVKGVAGGEITISTATTLTGVSVAE